MYYEAVKELNAEGFKRLTGVRPDVFEQMVRVLREAESRKKKSGRPSKLSVEDKLLLTLSYWREYRTQFHIAASYGPSTPPSPVSTKRRSGARRPTPTGSRRSRRPD